MIHTRAMTPLVAHILGTPPPAELGRGLSDLGGSTRPHRPKLAEEDRERDASCARFDPDQWARYRSVAEEAPMKKLAVLPAPIVLALSTLPVGAQGSNACPAVIAALLPKIGVEKTGRFTKAGDMGMGSGVAQIPFSHPCITSTKYPARMSVGITSYGGEAAAILQTQGDAADQQTIQDATEELARAYTSRGGKPSGKEPVKTEILPGATIVYVEFKSECPAEGAAGRGNRERPPIPNLRLKGVARTDNARMEISVEGQISAELAVSLVKEVVENLKRAKFAS